MQKESKKKIIIALATLIILLGSFAGINFLQNSVNAPPSEAKKDITEQRVSGLLREVKLNDLMTETSLIVYGTITNKSDTFQIEPASGGDPSNFTDFNLEPTTIYRGSISPQDNIPIRIQGGIANNLSVVCEDVPKLTIGNKYLMFLYNPGMGGGYNTEGNYYYIIGLTQGVFEEGNDGAFISMMGDEQISGLDFFTQQTGTYSKNPDTYTNIPKDTYIENQKNNLETGFITQEEYDQAIAESKKYAEIVE